jgi:hypothetical protein
MVLAHFAVLVLLSDPLTSCFSQDFKDGLDHSLRSRDLLCATF